MHSFSQRLPVDWLREHLAAEATHYLLPTLVQRLTHRLEMPLQWRCQQLLTVNTGEQIWGLLDVLPNTFDKIPETLDTASKKAIVNRIEHAVTVREWMERMADAQVHDAPAAWQPAGRSETAFEICRVPRLVGSLSVE